MKYNIKIVIESEGVVKNYAYGHDCSPDSLPTVASSNGKSAAIEFLANPVKVVEVKPIINEIVETADKASTFGIKKGK